MKREMRMKRVALLLATLATFAFMAPNVPAPAGNFSIWLRAYWPVQAILDGSWKPPVVSRAP